MKNNISVLRFFKKVLYHLPSIFLGLLIALLISTTIGVYQAILQSGSDYATFPDLVYKVFQILLFESGNITDDPAGWSWLGVSRIAAPLLTILFTIYGVYLVFTQAWTRFWTRFRTNHTLIIGMGANAKELMRYQPQERDCRIFVESDLSPEDFAFLKQCKVRFFKDTFEIHRKQSIHNAELCKRLNLQDAKRIIILTDDDGLNLKLALICHENLQKSKSQKSKKTPTPIYVGVNDLYTYYLVKESGLYDNMQITPVNLDLQCAELCLKKILPLKNLLSQSPQETFKPMHLVVLGFGALGQALVRLTAEIAHHQESMKIPVTLVDLQAQEKRDLFQGKFPHACKLLDIQEVSADILSQEAFNAIENLCRNATHRVVLVLTLNDLTKATTSALMLAENLRRLSVEFYLRVINPNDQGIPWIIQQFKVNPPKNCSFSEQAREIVAFGNDEELFEVLDVQKSQARLEAAKQYYMDYQLYTMIRETEIANKPTATLELDTLKQILHTPWPDRNNKAWSLYKDWTILEELYSKQWEDYAPSKKYSDYAAQSHAIHKLSTLGESMQSTPVRAEIQESLAKIEHIRWCAERTCNGWINIPGIDKDVTNKINSNLTLWEKLPREENKVDNQEYNRISVRTMLGVRGLLSADQAE